MTEAGRRVTLALKQSLVDFPLDDDIAVAAAMTLEEAVAMVNEHLLVQCAQRSMSQAERDELAREIIHEELVTRYQTEKARRSGSIH